MAFSTCGVRILSLDLARGTQVMVFVPSVRWIDSKSYRVYMIIVGLNKQSGKHVKPKMTNKKITKNCRRKLHADYISWDIYYIVASYLLKLFLNPSERNHMERIWTYLAWKIFHILYIRLAYVFYWFQGYKMELITVTVWSKYIDCHWWKCISTCLIFTLAIKYISE